MRFQYSFGLGFLFLFSLSFAVGFCNANEQIFEVVGMIENCVDCKENNFVINEAISGVYVTINCKLKSGKIKRVGESTLNQQGKFKISLPQEIILQHEQKLEENCYAQIHNAAATPCPAQNDLKAPKIVFKSQTNTKNTLTPTKNLQFSASLCTSKFLWPYFKYPSHFWKNKFPKLPFPLSPSSPLPKPRSKPKSKPLRPLVPMHKPKAKPPKKRLPPSVPVSKPKPEPPVVKKPMPPQIPLYPIPPFYKKPCPPFPKIPPHYFHHPKFGYFSPFPPFIPHP